MNCMKKGELSSLGYELRGIFLEIEEQFEDHLIAINENTSEILALYEGLSDIDNKLDKINERLEKIESFLQKVGFEKEYIMTDYVIEPLTKKEKEIFMVIYTLNESDGYITYSDISRRTGMADDLVSLYISEMIQKGIPFIKKYIDNKAYLKLSDTFMAKQAKENILNIEQRTINTTSYDN